MEAKKDWKTHLTTPETIEESNARIHCGDPKEMSYERGRLYHHEFFNLFFPGTQPKNGAHVLDVGIGVGWPMQALVDLILDVKITGLDISQSMIDNTKKRFSQLSNHAKYERACDFKLYDGETFPFNENTFDAIYSYAVLWDTPELIITKMMKEMIRVLKPGARCFLQFAPVHKFALDFENRHSEQIKNQLDISYFHYFFNPQNILRMMEAVKDVANMMEAVKDAVNFDIKRSHRNAWEDLYYITFTKSKDDIEPKFANESLKNAVNDLLMTPMSPEKIY